MNEVNLTTAVLGILGMMLGNAAFIIPMFLWVRSEANSDRRETRAIQAEDRKELISLVRTIQEDVRAIQDEIKDFHGRLCAIEERRGK